MKDILWTAYLAAMLFVTYIIVNKLLQDSIALFSPNLLKKDDNADSVQVGQILVACIMWAIWYMYYLH